MVEYLILYVILGHVLHLYAPHIFHLQLAAPTLPLLMVNLHSCEQGLTINLWKTISEA